MTKRHRHPGIPRSTADVPAWLANTPSDARLDIRLPRQLIDSVEKYATDRGWSLSFAVKHLLASGVQ